MGGTSGGIPHLQAPALLVHKTRNVLDKMPSTNVIESAFATVRLRTKKTKGCGTRMATLLIVFKLSEEAARTWRKIDASKKLHLVQERRRFVDGELVEESAA